MQIKFHEVKDKILTKINSLDFEKAGIFEETILVDGFISQPVYDEITGGVTIGGPSIPMICIVGKVSGRAYFFALKQLLPNDINYGS